MELIFCYLKGCPRCEGDLLFDETEWRCWQCGQYYYAIPGQPLDQCIHEIRMIDSEAVPVPDDGQPAVQEEGPHRRRGGYGARSARNINSVIGAKMLSDERWRERNRRVIAYLDQGLSIREIAKLVGKGERQIRVVRERLAELRAAAE